MKLEDLKGNACDAIGSVYDSMCGSNPSQPMCPVLDMVKQILGCQEETPIIE